MHDVDAVADASNVEQERELIAWIDGIEAHSRNCNGNMACPFTCVFRFVTVLGWANQ